MIDLSGSIRSEEVHQHGREEEEGRQEGRQESSQEGDKEEEVTSFFCF
jgi:predicted transposase YdaD